jgi:hypothetical protein
MDFWTAMGMVCVPVETLRFFASSGQELAYEIADWNTSGTSNIWVKVPSISGTTTVITAAWGKTGTESAPDYATNDPVWENDFQGVWHFGSTSTTFPRLFALMETMRQKILWVRPTQDRLAKPPLSQVRNLPM